MLLSSVVVNTTVDALFPPVTGMVSLRNAIATANASATPTTITFSPTVFATPQTLVLNGNQLELSGNTTTTIMGPSSGVTISANKLSRVLQVDSGVTATVSGALITAGNSGNGGAISNFSTLQLINDTVSNSVSPFGGGIYNKGTLTLVATTVIDNTATHNGEGGGGIANDRNATLSISNSTISNNTVTGSGGEGGGIENLGSLTVTDSTLSGNDVSDNQSTTRGGGIFNYNDNTTDGGTLTVTCSTLEGNSASEGGGIYNAYPYFTQETEILTINDSTISGNSAYQGGGVFSNAPILPPVSNSVIAGNTVSSGGTGPDVNGDFSSLGYNLIGKTDGSIGFNGADLTGTIAKPLNAKLGPLAKNGGPTETLLPLAGSPAIDHGLNVYIPKGITTDQRGLPRIYNGTVDIGGIEVQPPPNIVTIALTPGANQAAIVGKSQALSLGSFTQTGATGPFKATITWGDGSANASVNLTAAGVIPAVPHTFAKVGTYTVTESVADSAAHASKPVTFKVTVTATLNNASIAGRVFNDVNGDGKIDNGEVGLGLWTVYLDLNKDGKFDGADISATTDINGNFSFKGLAAGTYVVRVVPVSGIAATKPAGGVLTLTLAAGQASVGNLFGEKAIG